MEYIQVFRDWSVEDLADGLAFMAHSCNVKFVFADGMEAISREEIRNGLMQNLDIRCKAKSKRGPDNMAG